MVEYGDWYVMLPLKKGLNVNCGCVFGLSTNRNEVDIVLKCSFWNSLESKSFTTKDTGLVLWVAWAGLFCMMNYSTKYCSDCLELAKDPPTIEVIYLHKYFQIFIYFIWIDRKIWAANVASSDFSINSNKIDENLKIFMEVDHLNSRGVLSQL